MKNKGALKSLIWTLVKGLLVLLLTLCGTLGCLILFLYAFINDKIDTTSVSNVGFLMLIAIANICFTWARSFEKESLKLSKDLLNANGGLAIITAIFFLFGSLFKYIYTKTESNDMKDMLLGDKHVSQFLFNLSYSLCFFIAGILTILVLGTIIVVYFRMEEIVWELGKEDGNVSPQKIRLGKTTYIQFLSNKQRQKNHWRNIQ